MRAKRAKYPDITFRSMLEGQWTAVLDELGFTWEYEPVRFDLPSGVYVPDFRVTTPGGVMFWIEVKGPWPNAREFEVATEINIYGDVPLMIVTGDIPRQPNGGTSWWFNPDADTWSMLRPEESLIRIMTPDPARRAEHLDGWDRAIYAGRYVELIKVGSST